MIRRHLKPMFRFGIVGTIGTVVNMGGLWLLYSLISLPLWLASAVAIEASIIANFFGHTLFTFRNHEGHLWKRFFSYQWISLITAVLSWLVLNGLAWWLGTDPSWIVYVYNLIAICVGFFANYVLNRVFTWRASEI